jgi:serine/threonine-protein kinase
MYTAAGQGLLAAHDAGLIHRDFKPDNVLVDKDGRPRVADFGLARMDEKAGMAAPMSMRVEAIRSNDALPLLSPVTQAGTLIGTPLYMSPEQHLGDPIDSRSDQFSFCVALYEALYGKLPFAGTTIESLGFNACSGKVQPRPSGSPVPMSVHRAILRGLAPHPSQRFPSMRELIAALNYDPTLDQTAGPRVRRRVTIGMLAFMFIVLMGMNLLDKLGVPPLRASLVTAFAYFAFFVFLTFLFRRAFKNPFHRGMMVYGLGFGSQVLALRVVGLAIGLSHLQAVTLDLIAMAAMSAVAALLVLPTLWPLIPMSLASAVVAVLCPQLAQAVSSGAIVLGSSTALLLWSRRVKQGGLRKAKPWWKTDRHTPVPKPPA